MEKAREFPERRETFRIGFVHGRFVWQGRPTGGTKTNPYTVFRGFLEDDESWIDASSTGVCQACC